MLNFYKLKDRKIGISFSGDNYSYFVNLLVSSCSFKFYKKYLDRNKIWVGSSSVGEDIIPEMCAIDGRPLPSDILEWCNELAYETIFFRRKFIPEHFKAIPLGEYQTRGVKEGICQNRFYLAWPMRSGKSITVISIINHLIYYGLIDKILVLCPPEGLYNLKREFLKFNTFNLKSDEIYITDIKHREPFCENIKLAIMTYRSFIMVNDDAYIKKHNERSRSYNKTRLKLDQWGSNRAIILDEAQRIANPKSRTFKTCNINKHFFEYRYLLSGTPNPNKKIEGWYTPIRFMDPLYMNYPYQSFLEKVAVLGDRFSRYSVKEYKPDKIAKFIKEISPLVSKINIRDYRKFKENFIVKNYIGLTNKHEKIYKDFVKENLIKQNQKKGALLGKDFKNLFSYFMLSLDNPGIIKKEKVDEKFWSLLERWKFKDHSKLEALSSLIEKYVNEENRKVIIWSGHPLTLDMLSEKYSGYGSVTIHGNIDVPKGLTKKEHEDRLLTFFKEDKNYKILFASYKVLKTSIDLSIATRNIYFDRSWDFEEFEQTVKRIEGPNQKEDVITNILIFNQTIEERLDRNLEGKEDINKMLFKREEMSKEEWENLFWIPEKEN